MAVRAGLLVAFLIGGASLAGAAPDGSSANPTPTSAKRHVEPEEEPVSPIGLIIAGVALAGFAAILLIGRRKRHEPQAPNKDLADVYLMIETDERAFAWTNPAMHIAAEHGEVLLHLPVGTHEVHIQVGAEEFTRTLVIDRPRKMRIPVNLAKDRIARTVSAQMAQAEPAMRVSTPTQPPGRTRPSPTTGSPGLSSDPFAAAPRMAASPSPGPAPDASFGGISPAPSAPSAPTGESQVTFADQLASLIDVELTPTPAAAPDEIPDKPAASWGLDLDPHEPAPAPKAPRPAPQPVPKPIDAPLDLSPPVRSRTPTMDKPPAPVELGLDLGAPTAAPELEPLPQSPADLLPPSPRRKSPLTQQLMPEGGLDGGLGGLDSGLDSGLDRTPRRKASPTSQVLPPAPPRPSPLAHTRKKTPTVQRSPLADVSPAPGRPMPVSPLDAQGRAGADSESNRPVLDISLDDVPHKAAARTPASNASSASDLALDSLDNLAPPQPRTISSERGAPVAEFELAHSVHTPAAPGAPLPEVNATNVQDLTLGDGDDMSIRRLPKNMTSRPMPALTDVTLDDSPLELPARAAQVPARLAPLRPAAPAAATSALDDILDFGDSSAPTGQIGGRYERLAPLGVGSIGRLYRARDDVGSELMMEEVPGDARPVAPPELLVTLSSPNLVRFVDYIVDNSGGHVVTELVMGKSLAEMLAERRGFAALEAIGIIDQVCAALGYAHERGVFLGVQPSSVRISGRAVKLLGFVTSPRATPYTAPELAMRGGRPDARSDLYAVGVTLTELLTGAPPQGQLAFPADVPRTLQSVIRKLLSREPTIRPGSVQSVRDAFASIF